MAKQISIPHTFEAVPSSFDSTNSTYYQIASGYPTDNGLKDGSGTYAGFHMTRGSNAETKIYYNFDCSEIPNDATITSVTGSFRCSMSSSSTNYISQANLQFCSGTSVKGSSVSVLSTTAQYYDVNGGNSWTVAEVKNCKIRLYAKRGSKQQNSQYTARFFGGTLTITYTTQGIAYTITASSEVDGETLTPATQDIIAGESGWVKINVTDTTYRRLIDNNTNVTNQIVYIPPDTGGTLVRYPAGYTLGSESGVISGLNYVQVVGHGVENPANTSGTDKTATGGTTKTVYYTFDFSDIPNSATITNMTVQIQYFVSNTNYAQSANTYNGTSSKGTSITLNSTSVTTATISSPGTWTAAQLKDDPRVGITISYSGIAIKGVTWTVNYTATEPAYYRYNLTNLSADHTVIWQDATPAAGDIMFIKINGEWIECSKLFVKVNGAWVEDDLTYLSDNNIKYLKKGN